MSCIERKSSTSVPYGTSSETHCLRIEVLSYQKLKVLQKVR